MSKSDEISVQNPDNAWWVAVAIETWCYSDAKMSDKEKVDASDECLVLVEATNREEAYDKIIDIQKDPNPTELFNFRKRKRVKICFQGLSHLAPLKSPLKDGTEVFSRPLSSRATTSLDMIIRSREELI